MQDSFAIAAFEQWFELRRHVFERFDLRERLADSKFRCSNVQIDTPTHIASLCVWDINNALEIQIIDLATEEVSIEDGPNTDQDELLTRLNRFLVWFKQNHD